MTLARRAAALTSAVWATVLGGCLTPLPPVPVAARQSAVETAGFAADRADSIVPAVAIGRATESSAPPTAGDLAEYQRVAVEASPAVKQAAADVAAARGAALQAGLHPNPTVGYQGDQIGSGHTAGQQGVFVSQTFVTRGKLGLAQAAALAEVVRTELTFQQVQADVRAQVRARYFGLQAASEAVRVAEQMARTATALADRQRLLLESGQPVAPHEVDQARALAAAAGAELDQARHRLTAARRQVVVLAGIAPPVDPPPAAPLPDISLEQVQRAIDAHTELRAAAAQVDRARFQLELARVTPYPNVEAQTYLQRDYQTRTGQVGMQVGVALPVFDQNQGNIAAAEANLLRATHEAARARQDLNLRAAEVFERYTTNRRLADQYRAEILPAQEKAFSGLRKRFEQEPGRVSFSEVVLAQQTLANTYATYVRALTDAWQAVAELGRLAQTEDFGPAEIPDPRPVPGFDRQP